MMLGIDPLLALSVVAHRRVPAASWSGIRYVLSSFAVISCANNWIYVLFAAAGSWIGACHHDLPARAAEPPAGAARVLACR